MAGHLELIREFADLERRRCGDGLTPLEYQRWLDLEGRLERRFASPPPTRRPAAPAQGTTERRKSPRRATRMRVEFKTPGAFRSAYIKDLSRGGVFVNTPFAPEIGTELVLRIEVRSTGRVYEIDGVVVTNNVAAGFTTDSLGMGVHFRRLTPEQRLAIDELFALAEDEGT